MTRDGVNQTAAPTPVLRLTKDQRAQWMRRLSSWQAPQCMIDKAEEVRELLGSEALVQPRAGFFREAFVAGRFADVRHADHVRLVHPDPRPDFELRFGSRVEAFELVEADTAGRRRDLEIRLERDAGVEVVPFPVEEWLTPGEAQSLLQAAAVKKSDGRYDPACRLLIYLNPVEFDVHRAAILAAMKPATASAKDRFAEVWVMWKGEAFQTW